MSRSVCQEDNFHELYTAYAKSLRNYLYYKCGDLNKAEDLSQEALIKLWENCKSVVFEKAKSYLYTVGQRLMINQIRHEKVVLNFEKGSNLSVNQEDPDYVLREKDFGVQLEQAISALPEIQREVFLMNRIDKLSYGEIADLLGLSVKAVEKRMHNALENLRNSVKELGIYKF